MASLTKYLRPFLVLGLFLVFVIYFRSFFVIHIIEPIVLMCWAVWRMIASVDQSVYWVILLLICAIPVIRLIPGGKSDRPRSAYEYTYRARDRVEHWKALMAEAVLGKAETENLRESLKKLSISAIPQIEGSNPADAKKIAEIENVRLSREARRYLWPPRESRRIFSTGHRFNPIFLVPRRLRRRAAKFIPWDTTAIDEILKWLETEMEMSHDQ